MKINVQGNYNIYKNTSSEQGAGKAKNESFSGILKTDLNALPKGATEIPDKHMLAMKSSVQSYVFEPVSSEKIAGIRERIQNGTYRVSSDDIAGAIMDDSL